jgi:hypothetical protein
MQSKMSIESEARGPAWRTRWGASKHESLRFTCLRRRMVCGGTSETMCERRLSGRSSKPFGVNGEFMSCLFGAIERWGVVSLVFWI